MAGENSIVLAVPEPPPTDVAWRYATEAVRLQYYRHAADIALSLKQKEIRKGVGVDGKPLAPVKRASRPDGATGPPLTPHYAESRSRKWLRASIGLKAGTVTLWWSHGWGTILGYHADGLVIGAYIRDVIGLTEADEKKFQAEMRAYWRRINRGEMPPPTARVPTPPTLPTLPLPQRKIAAKHPPIAPYLVRPPGERADLRLKPKAARAAIEKAKAAEKARIEAELARARVEAEKAERERLAAEKARREAEAKARVEAARIAAEKARIEAERLAAERERLRVEKARIEAERAAAELAKLKAQEAERERARLAAEKKPAAEAMANGGKYVVEYGPKDRRGDAQTQIQLGTFGGLTADQFDPDIELARIKDVDRHTRQLLADHAEFVKKIDADGHTMVENRDISIGQSHYFTAQEDRVGWGVGDKGVFKLYPLPYTIKQKPDFPSWVADDLHLDAVYVQVHESHHGFGSHTEFDAFSEAVALDYHLKTGNVLNTNAVDRLLRDKITWAFRKATGELAASIKRDREVIRFLYSQHPEATTQAAAEVYPSSDLAATIKGWKK